jgi:hypothetical protein
MSRLSSVPTTKAAREVGLQARPERNAANWNRGRNAGLEGAGYAKHDQEWCRERAQLAEHEFVHVAIHWQSSTT